MKFCGLYNIYTAVLQYEYQNDRNYGTSSGRILINFAAAYGSFHTKTGVMLRGRSNLLWRRVHPDLFARWPAAQSANQVAMQELRALLETTGGSAVPQPQQPKAQDFRFFVQTGADADAGVCVEANLPTLREISSTWRPPSSLVASTLSAEAHARLWERSVETCVDRLLRQIDPQLAPEPAGEGSRDRETTRREPSDADIEGDVVRAASAAAARRRRQSKAPPTEPPPVAPAGGELRREMLFYHDVPESQRPVVTARLAGLLHEVQPAGVPHGPILLYGSTPPAGTATAGFACVPIDVDAAVLRERLKAAARSPAGLDAAARRAEAQAVLIAGRRLRAALGCEAVLTGGVPSADYDTLDSSKGWASVGVGARGGSSLSPTEASPMLSVLLEDAPRLRATLDVDWGGLHVWLDVAPEAEDRSHADEAQATWHGASAAGSEAVAVGGRQTHAPIEIVDAHCGACALVVRGLEGASSALDFARQHWKALRSCQQRFHLAEELRERLDCAAIECLGTPSAAALQCAALRRLLHVLRRETILLPDAALHPLAHVTISLVDDPTASPYGAHGVHLAQPPAAPSRATRSASLKRSPPHVHLCLPDDFNVDEALMLLTQLASAPTPGSSGSRRAGRPDARQHRGGGRRQRRR